MSKRTLNTKSARAESLQALVRDPSATKSPSHEQEFDRWQLDFTPSILVQEIPDRYED